MGLGSSLVSGIIADAVHAAVQSPRQAPAPEVVRAII